MKNLGDKVEKMAKPVAKALDKFLKTDLEHCKDCEEVKRLLNDGKLAEALMLRLGMKKDDA